jgi:hypothetical protein
MDKRIEIFKDMVLLAERALEELTEDEIQELYGSDYYFELKRYIKRMYWGS